MTSIYARLHEAVTQPALDGLHLVIGLEDLTELDGRIRDLCRTEGTCSICEARLCPGHCQIGEPVECEVDPVYHCRPCQSECNRCSQAMRGAR